MKEVEVEVGRRPVCRVRETVRRRMDAETMVVTDVVVLSRCKQ